MNIRSFVFWFIDNLKNKIIRKNIEQIKFINENFNREYISDEKYKILDYALENIDFYKNKHYKINFEHLVLVNKNTFKKNIYLFLNRHFEKTNLVEVVTSGSTGTPFISYQNKTKAKRNTADTLFFAKKAGYILGEKLYYIKIWNSINLKNIKSRISQNIICIDVTNQSEEDLLNFYNNVESNKKSVHLLGYASFFEALINIISKNNLKLTKVKSAISMSEALSPFAKEEFFKLSGVELISRYSNVENGILAQQVLGSKTDFLINWASYFIEILKLDSNEPCSYGEKGRIIVTDFYNKAMPFIRYDTGDVGVMEWSEIHKQPVLKEVGGRKMDLIYDTKGRLMSSFIITNNMWLFPEILQYQFIQHDKKIYEFKLNVKWNREIKEKELLSIFKPLFGKDSLIKISYLDEIPLLASGKRKKVINKINSK